jgi:cytochrome c oxidase cbb3-type subunit IV
LYKELLQSIEGIEVYPIISLLIFLALFAGVVIWIIKLDKKYIKEVGALPLDNSEDKNINKQMNLEN